MYNYGLENYDKLCVLFRGDKTKCAIRSFTGMDRVKTEVFRVCLTSQRNSFSLPRKSMVLNYNKARIKRANQLIDVLNIDTMFKILTLKICQTFITLKSLCNSYS